MCFPLVFSVFVCVAVITVPVCAQSPNGNINGLVCDPSNAAVAGAEIIAVNDVTRVQYMTNTNNEGIYVLPSLPPGPYRVQVSKTGFKTVIKPDIVLNVQDALSINFTLPVGAAHEILTVEGGAASMNAENSTVSTVVDRQFADNLPMNGRSFQTLIQLTPGVVLDRSTPEDSGQFSINGQRASSNYWMVDGVSANIGVGATAAGNGFGGASASFSVLGGTNSLVSVDALQEFRIQTSTYAPEFGRTPGGQISIVTRSGTNQFHGTAFDYLRNDVFDASDWFNGYINDPPLPKAKERQNDFGGTLGGPLVKDRTFFFLSYEGLRLRLPQTTLTTVPDLNARQNAIAAMQPYFKAFPNPNGSEVLDGDGNPSGAAVFNASYSNPATLDAFSVRLDHKVSHTINMFGRYDYSPSKLIQRGPSSFALSVVDPTRITTETLTAGGTWAISTTKVNDLRLNYSRTSAVSSSYLDSLGGAAPLAQLPLPTPYTAENGNFLLANFSLTNGVIDAGQTSFSHQRQINIVNSLSIQIGSHSVKIGGDLRRLSPTYQPAAYLQDIFFPDVSSSETGSPLFSIVRSIRTAQLIFHNLGLFAQDAWRVSSNLTMTYGVRWDVDFAPGSSNSINVPRVTGFDPSNLSQLALAPGGSPFRTKYNNFAPRVGLAYKLPRSPNRETVLRGGLGIFYDLATSEVGNGISPYYPFGASNIAFGGTFPLTPDAAAPPAITASSLATGVLYAFDPNLRLPYSLEWNLAIEQALGQQQSMSISYVGSSGRRLLQSLVISSPNPNFGEANLVANKAISNYNALQLQFKRRLIHGLQALASYSWAHSIDTASAGSFAGNPANGFVPSGPNANRGPSDFDIRNAFSAGVTYSVPTPQAGFLLRALIGGWSFENVFQGRSAAPVNLNDGLLSQLLDGVNVAIRPDVVPGEPVSLSGPQYPGGRAFNPKAFTPPPVDPNGQPLRQGDVGRNAMRAFGCFQWDVSIHRDFPLSDRLKLQFRAETFNVLNHPNFGPPIGDISQTNFGLARQVLSQSLNGGNLGGGGFDPLYQMGGPRSMQFALKVLF